MRTYSLGIILKIINLLLITVYSLLLLKVGHGHHIVQLCFLLASSAVLILCTLMCIMGINFQLSQRSILLHIARAIFNCLGIITWIYALRDLGANEATAISYTIPIFTTILAIALCNEKFNKQCFGAILVSTVGMYIILQPHLANNYLGALIALISSIMWACYDIICKKQGQTEHYIKQAFYNFLFTSILFSPFAIFQWQAVNALYLMQIFGISILSATNVVVLFLAYKFAPIVVLMPFSYLRLIFMAIATYVTYQHIIAINIIIGAIIICSATIFIFLQQKRGKL